MPPDQERRRADDRRMERLEDAVDKLVGQVAAVTAQVQSHAAVCTEAEHGRAVRWEANDARAERMEGKIDRLIAEAQRRAGAIWAARAIWVALAALLGFVAWAWEHVAKLLPLWLAKPAVLLLLAGGLPTAHAEPPPGAPTSGPVHDWFQQPHVKACCSAADCRPHRVRATAAGGWEVEHEGAWLAVPASAIKTDGSPTAQTIVCIPPGTGVPLCLFFGGGV